jgi:DNA-binding transcriptional LysR family regulator
MSNRPLDWSLQQTFVEVMRDRSLSGAARRLALTQPTVGRQIDALEAKLGQVLFKRSRRGLTPTIVAMELLPHAEAMAAAQEAFLRAASGGARGEEGVVRLTASEMIGCEVLPPILAAFRQEHPGVTLELVVSNRVQNLDRNDADIAVRMMRPSQTTLIARRIGETHISLFAHRDYLRAHGTPTALDQLAGHALIGFDRDDSPYRGLMKAGFDVSRDTFNFRTDSDYAQFAALRAGLGIGGCQIAIAARYPELIQLPIKAMKLKLEIWLAMHEAIKSTRRVRLLFDHLNKHLSEYAKRDKVLRSR